MELITFTIGIIIGIIMRDLLKVIKTILSIITTYIVVHLIHPELELLPFKEWTFLNLFTGYNFYMLVIISFVSSLLIFYYIIPLFINKYVIVKLISKYNVLLKEPYLNIWFKEYVKRTLNKSLNFYKKYSPSKDEFDTTKKVKFNQISEVLVSAFSLSFHILICALFFISTINVVLLILLFIWIMILIYHIIYIPMYHGYIDLLNEIADDNLKDS